MDLYQGTGCLHGGRARQPSRALAPSMPRSTHSTTTRTVPRNLIIHSCNCPLSPRPPAACDYLDRALVHLHTATSWPQGLTDVTRCFRGGPQSCRAGRGCSSAPASQSRRGQRPRPHLGQPPCTHSLLTPPSIRLCRNSPAAIHSIMAWLGHPAWEREPCSGGAAHNTGMTMTGLPATATA